MMAVHDQARSGRSGDIVDHREAVFVGRGCLMRDQDVEAFGGEAVDVLGENGVAVP